MQNSSNKYDVSVLIPTWNNLPLLRNCIESIQENSKSNIQILVYVNEGKDGSAQWLSDHNIQYLESDSNIGICVAMNALRKLVQSDLICYLNDDMYVLPDWDTTVINRIKSLEKQQYFVSSTMIEPRDSGSKVTIFGAYGTTLDQFKKDKLLEEYQSLERDDWNGSSWPPLFLPVKLWDKIGGFSEEFSPGMYSDPDMAKKAWEQGNRVYLGVGNSLVYHFGSASTTRIKKNKGRQTFILKWGMSSRFFYQKFLTMGSHYEGPLKEYRINLVDRIINKVKVWRES